MCGQLPSGRAPAPLPVGQFPQRVLCQLCVLRRRSLSLPVIFQIEPHRPQDPAVLVAAIADGLAVEFGNVLLAGSSCEIAAPGGLSTPGGCVLGVPNGVESPVPVDTVLGHFRAQIPGTAATNVEIGIATTDNVNFGFSISCTILAGDSSCTSAGPSATVSAGTFIILNAKTTSATRVSFSYEMGKPGVSFAPNPQPNTTRRLRLK